MMEHGRVAFPAGEANALELLGGVLAHSFARVSAAWPDFDTTALLAGTAGALATSFALAGALAAGALADIAGASAGITGALTGIACALGGTVGALPNTADALAGTADALPGTADADAS